MTELWSLGAGLLGLIVAFLFGKFKQNRAAKEKARREYFETKDRINETNLGDDPAVARDFLRARSERDSDL